MIPRDVRLPYAINVVIVDDHPLFRDGLRQALELHRDIRVIGQCADGHEAVDMASAKRPDVVILDINLPSMNGLQVARLIKAEQPEVAIVMLTAYHDAEQVLHAMRSGASAYCEKNVTPERLIETIRAVAAGYYVVDNQRMDAQELARWFDLNVTTVIGAETAAKFVPLSPREMEILQLITQGMSNKEIASTLNISQQTVKNHMTSILKKLHVQDRTQAAVTALRHGWVRLNDR